MKRLAELSQSFRVASRFRTELSGHGRSLLLVAALFLGAILLELARPWPLRWVIDGVFAAPEPPDSPARIIWIAGAALLGVLVLKAAFEYAATLLMTAVGHGVTRNLRLRIFRHMVGLSPAFHARHKSGDLLVRLMGDVPMVKDMLVDASLQMSVRAVQALGILAMLLWIDPTLAMAVLVPIPLLLLAVRFLSGKLHIAVRKQRRKEGELADYLHEAVEGSVVLQAMGRSDHAVRRFARSNRRSARAGLKAARASARLSGAVEALLAVGFAGTLTFGALRVDAGHLRLGELVVFLSYVRGLLKPIRSASKHQARVAKGTACGERLLRVLDERPEVVSPVQGKAPADRPETLVFDRVDYTYPDGQVALRSVDLRFQRGELAALVGHSGAGKSTLVALALRVMDPDRGHIRLDGELLTDIDLAALRERFGLSMQHTYLFGESLRENLLLGKPDATEEELWRALEASAVSDLVRELPEGLDDELGAGGVGLSGGEARRICLARALLREAPVLIVDEPFSGLDRPTASRLFRTLREAAKDRIVIVVTHAVEHLDQFDRVIHLDSGAVRAEGAHEDLLQDAEYAALVGGAL